MRGLEKEKRQEIRDQLKVVSDIMGVPILDAELDTMATRLVRFHSKELFEIIARIPQGKYFPACHALEQEARKALGLPPVGLTLDLIEKNETELVVSGQDPVKAKRGAEFVKRTLLRKAHEAVKSPEAQEAIAVGVAAMRVQFDEAEGVKTTPVSAQEMAIETWEDQPEEKPKIVFEPESF